MPLRFRNNFCVILAIVISLMIFSESDAGKGDLSSQHIRAYRQVALEEDRKRQQAAVVKKEYRRLKEDRRRLLRDRKVLQKKIRRLKKSERVAEKEAQRCQDEARRLENEYRNRPDGGRKPRDDFEKIKETQEKFLGQMKTHQEARRLTYEERQRLEADIKKKKTGLDAVGHQMTQNRRQRQRPAAPTVP